MSAPLNVSKPLLVLDVLGSLLMLWGLIEHFGWYTLMPEAWRFPFYPAVLLVTGLLLITPYQFAVVLAALRQRGRNPHRS